VLWKNHQFERNLDVKKGVGGIRCHLSKEPYPLSKEPYIFSKELMYSQKSHRFERDLDIKEGVGGIRCSLPLGCFPDHLLCVVEGHLCVCVLRGGAGRGEGGL